MFSNSRTITREYWICGTTTVAEIFDIRENGRSELKDLIYKFKTIVEDFLEPLEPDRNSMAVEFSSKVLFEIGPKVRKQSTQEGYILKFKYKDENGEPYFKIVQLRKNLLNRPGDIFVPGHKICLSVRNAELLAILVLKQIIPMALEKDNVKLLTPIAAACFKRDDIDKIAQETGMSLIDVLIDINASCQPGGQLLEDSKLHIALCVVIACTRSGTDNVRVNTIDKILDEYRKVKKPLDVAMFEVYARYLVGGLPDRFNLESLISKCKTVPELTNKPTAQACVSTQPS